VSIAFKLPGAHRVADQIEKWRAEHAAFAVLLKKPGSPSFALRQFGSTCRDKRQYDIAAEALLAALTFEPEDAWLWRELASMYQFTNHEDLAEACALQSLSIDPHHAATWLQYASSADRLQHTAESERAYLRALSLDPTLSDAHLGLGVLYLRDGKFENTSRHLRLTVSLGGGDAPTYLCLGQSLYMTAHFADSAEAFERAAAFGELQGTTRRIHARARTFAAMLDGNIAKAIADYPALAGDDAEPVDDILREAFSLFSAYGMREAAVAVGRFRLACGSDDPVQRYLLDAVAGSPHDRAPAAYVERHFDEFAEGFDGKLVDVLGYRVPQELAHLVASCQLQFSALLDLGCGTGLAAEPLRPFGGNLTGVDLSQRMLDVAARRGVYGALVKADVTDFLRGKQSAFDLVFAADLLIYFGALNDLIDAIADALRADGLFAASIERADRPGFVLLPSGRFAHAAADFEAEVSKRFAVVGKRETTLRLEAGRPVPGILYVMRLAGS
jgi:predicted TPR repeat methyltransferase